MIRCNMVTVIIYLYVDSYIKILDVIVFGKKESREEEEAKNKILRAKFDF